MIIYGFNISLNEIILGTVKEESFDEMVLKSFPYAVGDVKALVRTTVRDININLKKGSLVLYKDENSIHYLSRYGISEYSEEEIRSRYQFSRELTKKEATTLLLKYTLDVYDV